MQYLETDSHLWAHGNVYSFLAHPRNGATLKEGTPFLNTSGDVLGRVKDVLDGGAVRITLHRGGRGDAWNMRGRILRGELWMLIERQTIRLQPASDREQFLSKAADELAALRSPRSSAVLRLVPAVVSALAMSSGWFQVHAGASGLLPTLGI